ncbi:QRFP-like peptide receptor [Pecten maximus]|uniref:QRFP-like peptide receptor n=1 Tax=Pecten maximus TaxID=6579 RepID=UPI001457FECD|nr:QRFP-like peptide receptor [Pecten maximus]
MALHKDSTDGCVKCNVSTMSEIYVDATQSSLNTSTFYTYDYDYSDYSLPLQEIVPVALVYGATLVLGIVGNILVIFSVTRFQRLKTITNTFLVSLASADLLVIIVCVPTKFAAFFTFTWRLGEVMCKGVHYIQNVSAICSVTTLTAMSLERYYAIIHPVRAKYVCTVGRAQRLICILWVAAFVLACPIIIGREHLEVHGIHRKATWCKKNFQSVGISILYEVFMLMVILIIPVIVMSFAYLNICKELWNIASQQHCPCPSKGELSKANSNDMVTITTPRKSKDDNKSKKQVIKMLVAIIIIFIICWAPLLINNVLVGFKLLPDLNIDHHKHIREALHIMAYSNSCVNPVVYTFMSRNFKETFKQTLCGCLRRTRRYRKNTLEAGTSFHNGKTYNTSINGDSSVIVNRNAVELSSCQYGTTAETV